MTLDLLELARFGMKRDKAVQVIRDRLERADFKLISAEVGRVKDEVVWVVAVYRPDCVVQTYHAPLKKGQDSWSDATCKEVAERLIRYYVSKSGVVRPDMSDIDAMEGVGILHLYSPLGPHCDATIKGSRDAITALRNACDRALSGEHGTVLHWASDGEGMRTIVQVVTDEEAKALPHAYTDEAYRS